MPELALVTGSDHAAAYFVGVTDPEADVDAPLRSALEARGAGVHRPLWSDPTIDWGRFDLAVVRTTYDYVDDRDDFVAWAARASNDVTLLNPADVLRWNTHKSYLIELEERGAPVVPTAWLAKGDDVRLGELLQLRGWSDVVLKPAIGAGSDGIVRVAEADAHDVGQDRLAALLARGDVMIQPFRPRIARGELSIIAIEGRITHAVRKIPAAGEFRVQGRFGGSYVRERLTDAASALAAWILETLGTPLLFARVDLVEADDGSLELAEVEATEPDLYLHQAPEAADILADAILRRAGGARPEHHHADGRSRP